MHTSWERVLSFPQKAAARTTPLDAAMLLKEDTTNSLARIMMQAQDESIPCSKRIRRADMTSNLSARGSTSLPKSVIWLYFLAIYPSIPSVRLAILPDYTAVKLAGGAFKNFHRDKLAFINRFVFKKYNTVYIDRVHI